MFDVGLAQERRVSVPDRAEPQRQRLETLSARAELSPQRVLALQRAAGNAAVAARLAGGEPQAALPPVVAARSALQLQRSVRLRASANVGTRGLIQRRVEIATVRQSRHSLSSALKQVITGDRAWRALWPIALEWIKSPTTYQAANPNALRTQLVAEYLARLVPKHADCLPTLSRHLAPAQFNTIVLMSEFERFNAARFEAAVKAAISSKNVDQPSVVASLASASFLPATAATFAIFTTDFAAFEPGVMGLSAELEAAASVNPAGILGKAVMGVDYDLGGVIIGGQTTQDADLSLTGRDGTKMFVEIAATLDRLATKLGPLGAQQRARYDQLALITPHSQVGYSVPGTAWYEFFRRNFIGDLVALNPPRGLMIEGYFRSGADLQAVQDTIDEAEPEVADFWGALRRAGLTYEGVRSMSGRQLASRLQRNVK